MSGFFGGLSGNQGALRSAFLIKSGLTRESFIATGVVLAVIVDIARLTVYGSSILSKVLTMESALLLPVLIAVLCAFLGSVLGKKILHKITLDIVRVIVALGMVAIGLGITAGVI